MPMPGLRQEYLKMSSAAIAGPTTSPVGKRRAIAELREQIAAHQRAGRFLEEHAGVPAVRRVRRVDDSGRACRRRGRSPRRRASARGVRSAKSLSDTMQPVRPCAAVRLGRGGKPLVHRAAFVGLEMAEGDPAQALGRDDAAQGVRG